MRVIKFRAWDKIEKRMVPYDKLMVTSGALLYKAFEHASKTFDFMQYTSLKDKNGNDIYEGDILTLNEPLHIDKQTNFGIFKVLFGTYDDSEIEYGSPAIGWYVNGYHGYNRLDGTIDKYEIKGNSLLTVYDKYEIIGNIYENPELLENKNG